MYDQKLMIGGKEFRRICRESDLIEKKGIKVEFEDDTDMQVAVIKYEGRIYCLDNICPHKHAAEIYNGIVTDGTVTCPLHGWNYNLADGSNTNRKQGIKSLGCYDVRVIDGWVYIEKPPLIIPKWRQTQNIFD